MPTIYTDKSKLPERQEQEFYPTERSLIKAALAPILLYKRVHRILDAGAGDGRWGEIAASYFWTPPAYLVGVEIRKVESPPAFDEWHCKDFLKFTSKKPFDLIVSNPPYAGKTRPPLSEQFINHAWDLLALGGRMVFLLPLDYQVGKGRYDRLYQDRPPALVMPVVRRIAFIGGNGGTNNHAVFVWRKGLDGQAIGKPNEWPVKQLYHEREGIAA